MNNKTTDVEYQRLKAFLGIYSDKFLPSSIDSPPEHHPIAILESFERKSMAEARKGLRITVEAVEKP